MNCAVGKDGWSIATADRCGWATEVIASRSAAAGNIVRKRTCIDDECATVRENRATKSRAATASACSTATANTTMTTAKNRGTAIATVSARCCSTPAASAAAKATEASNATGVVATAATAATCVAACTTGRSIAALATEISAAGSTVSGK